MNDILFLILKKNRMFHYIIKRFSTFTSTFESKKILRIKFINYIKSIIYMHVNLLLHFNLITNYLKRNVYFLLYREVVIINKNR